MKIRNKKTGKVQTCDFAVISDDSRRDGELLKLKSHIFVFRSIKQLNEEYEDYGPVEPLIKDENVRKAVRAWADNIRAVMCDGEIRFYAGKPFCSFHTDIWRAHNDTKNIAEINLVLDEGSLEDGAKYTIAELCGEEEE